MLKTLTNIPHSPGRFCQLQSFGNIFQIHSKKGLVFSKTKHNNDTKTPGTDNSQLNACEYSWRGGIC